MKEKNMYLWAFKNIKDNRISIHAAQVAFFTIVSFFPFLMFFITLLKHTPISEAVLLATIQKIIPASLTSLISTWLNESFKASTTLLSATVISALWAGSKGFSSIAYELEIIYNDKESETRTFIARRLHSVLDTILFTIMIIISLILLVFGNQIIQLINRFLPFMRHMTLLLFLFRSAFSLLLFIIYFSFMYYFIPGRHAHLKEELPGAILASFLWITFSYLYSFYVDTWGTISSVYGSLTSIVLLMLWLYFCITFVFLGALLNKYIQTYHTFHPIKDLKKISPIVSYCLKNKI